MYSINETGVGRVLKLVRRFIFIGLIFLLCCCKCIQCDLQGVPLVGKSTLQGFTLSGYTAQNALDGNVNTFACTAVNDPHPWWQVDLGTDYCLGKVIVTLRQDCCNLYRFTGALARAGLRSNYAENQPCGVPATREQSTTGAVNEILCDPPRMARYVSLDIDTSLPDVTDAYLQLAEVEVFNYTSGECDPQEPNPVGPAVKSCNFKMLRKYNVIVDSEPLATKMARSPLRCAAFCISHSQCMSFDYAPGINQCHLYNISAAYIQITPHQDFSVYVLGD